MTTNKLKTTLKKEPEAMSFFEINDEYSNLIHLTKNLPLLDNDSQEIILADLSAISNSRSIEIDKLYKTLENFEREIEYWQKQEEEVKKSKTHAQNTVKRLKESIRGIRRRLPQGKEFNSIAGRDYQFTVTPITPGQAYSFKYIQTKDFSDFSSKEQESFFLKKETIQTKKTVISSISGKHIKEEESSNPKSEIILNENTISNAHKENKLPDGIRVIQNYKITRKTICREVELETSTHPEQFFRESTSS